MKDFLTPLEGIKQVEAPPFLLPRIQQRIQNEMGTRFSMKTTYAIAASFVVLFALNIFILVTNQPARVEENDIAKAFYLMPNNNLYE